MNTILKYLMLLMTAVISFTACAQKMDATAFDAALKATKTPQLIDVRTAEEFAGGHIADAQNFNWNGGRFDQQIANLNKDQAVFVYCQGGGRSAAASAHLKKAGFTKVYDLDGGIIAWRAAKMPEVGVEQKAAGMTMEAYEQLLQSKQMVLVDFYADWCVPCKKMKPFLEKMEKDKTLDIAIIRINADEHAELATALNVDGLPYLKLYNSQNEVWEHKGFIDETNLRKAINSKKK